VADSRLIERQPSCYAPRMAYGPEFQEIAHCGGKVIVRVSTDSNGRRGVSIGVEHSTPKPAAWFPVHALPQGLPVFVGSDSFGLFGHQCPECSGYWRSQAAPSAWNLTCPYCGMDAQTHEFLTPGQQQFVMTVCEVTMRAVRGGVDGEHVIDMDHVADQVAKTSQRPSFYHTEQSQQNHYTCSACGSADDILGRYGYCSCCGTRNDLHELTLTIETINAKTRERIKAGEPLESAVPETVSAFDSVARQYAKQLAKLVPMKRERRTSLEGALFHNLKKAEDLKTWFGINLFGGLDADDVAFIRLMFHRRHVYEHNGGEVDQRYLDESGDTSVRLKQALREKPESVFRMTGTIVKMGRSLHEGFHELFPPMERPIEMYRAQQADLRASRQGH